METLIHADIFFFVTTIAVVVVGVVFTIALCYLVAILRQMRDILRHIKEETMLVRADIRDARTRVQAEGFRLKHILDFFSGIKGREKQDGGSRKRSK